MDLRCFQCNAGRHWICYPLQFQDLPQRTQRKEIIITYAPDWSVFNQAQSCLIVPNRAILSVGLGFQDGTE